MAAFQLKDFKDIVDAISEELGIQASDTTARNRIKRDVNAAYIYEVVPSQRWWWLNGQVSKQFKPVYDAETASVTPDSTTITLSTFVPAAQGSKKDFFFSTDNFTEIYRIASHTAGTDTITLSSEYTGTLDATAKFKIWTDRVDLPTDCRETFEVFHDHTGRPLDGMGLQEFRREVAYDPKKTGRPVFYTTYDFLDPTAGDAETESDRIRQTLVYPAINTKSTTIHVDYIKEASALDLDGDEPLMPIEDRIVLVYGALVRGWSKRDDLDKASLNQALFDRKLAAMAGRIEDSFDKPQLTPSSRYIVNKRGPRIGRLSRFAITSTRTGGSGAGNPTITFLKNVTIEGATITANVMVNSLITIDGRDLSVDGAALDAHIAASSGVHGVTGDIVGTTSIQTLSNKTFAQNLDPSAHNTYDIGSNAVRWKDLFLANNADIDGTLNVAGTSTLGVATLSGALTLGTLTTGSIPFAGTAGLISQDNANLFWDDTNNRLGIGTATPLDPLHIVGDIRWDEGVASQVILKTDIGIEAVKMSSSGVIAMRFSSPTLDNGSTSDWLFRTWNGASNQNTFQMSVTRCAFPTTDFGVQTSSPRGTADIDGASDQVQLIVEGHSTQTSALQEWRDSSATVLSHIDETGDLHLGAKEETVLATVALNDNQAAAADVFTYTAASFEHAIVEYSISRGAGNRETGHIFISNDGTSVADSQFANTLGTIGVTLTTDINAGNVRLRYTSTSTGTAPSFKYSIKRWDA